MPIRVEKALLVLKKPHGSFTVRQAQDSFPSVRAGFRSLSLVY
jgi:hypothetical protein